jgi:hypothetical protein
MPAESATPRCPRPRFLESAPCAVRRAMSRRVIAGEGAWISRSDDRRPAGAQAARNDSTPNDQRSDGPDLRPEWISAARSVGNSSTASMPLMRSPTIRIGQPIGGRLTVRPASTVPVFARRDCDAAEGRRRPSSNEPSLPAFWSASLAAVTTVGRRHAFHLFG